MQMLNRARAVIRKYGTNDPESILELLKVKLFFLSMSGIRGIYKRIEGHTIVFVDSNLDERTRTFCCLPTSWGHHLYIRARIAFFLTAALCSRRHATKMKPTCLLRAFWPLLAG